MWLIISGILILLLASFLRSYCAFGIHALPTISPQIFSSAIVVILLQIGWILLFLTGIGMIFIVNWVWGIIAAVWYWFALPLLTMPIMRKFMLPSWDMIKDKLEKLGYTKNNYLHGDWWKDLPYKKNFNK